MHLVVIERNTDRKALRDLLLRKRLDSGRADAAMRSVEEANRHVSLDDLAPGTVLLVPAGAEFRAAATMSSSASQLDALQAMVRTSLDASAARIATGNKMRAAQRAEVAAAMKVASVKKMAEADPELKDALTQTAARLKQEEKDDEGTEADLGTVAKRALSDLEALAKIVR